MNFNKIFTICLFSAFCILSYGIPARRSHIILTQPDGSTFQAVLSGDEHMHLLTTGNGAAVTQDEDGWYSYAAFDSQGGRFSSGYHVGAHGTPSGVITASRNIPYAKLWSARNYKLGKFMATRSLRPNIIRRMQEMHPVTRAGEGSTVRHGLIILAQFKDIEFTHTREEFNYVINGPRSGSAVEYFNDQFHNAYDFRFDITDIVPLPREYSFYGKNNSKGEDMYPHLMVRDACLLVDDKVDFSKYDNDGDGEVDNVFVWFSGTDEADGASSNHIWSHMWYLSSGVDEDNNPVRLTLDGKVIDNYACTSEIMYSYNYNKNILADIGTFCHEYSHTFGLPDLYDTDGSASGGDADGCWGSPALMHAGNTNNDSSTPPYYTALDRHLLGMGNPMDLTEGEHTLRPVHIAGDYYKVNTDTEGEYYLIECRSNEGWDAYCGGKGMLIYHIDQSPGRIIGNYDDGDRLLPYTALDTWEGLNMVNCIPSHQCADIIEADPSTVGKYATASTLAAQARLVKRIFWPWEENNSFSASTNPAFVFWSGKESSLALTGITINADGSVRFTVLKNSTIPELTITSQQNFQDASIIRWAAADPEFDGKACISWGMSGKELGQEVEVEPYEKGKYAYTIEGLSPMTTYRVRIVLRLNGLEGKPNEKGTFTTNRLISRTHPYIFFKNIDFAEDGSIASGTELPLRVYNAPSVEKVHWSLDGKSISTGANGYYKATRSGVLKAVVKYNDGTTDIIVKNLKVK